MNEIIEFNGINFKVLDTNQIDFSKGVYGVKNTITKVIKAKGGEKIETKNNKGEIESVLIANAGDAIFCNNETDVYIPHDKSGASWKFDNIENYGYDIIKSEENCVYIQSNNKALLLVEAVTQPSCIKNAWGEGNHQFLYEGATLKKDLKTKEVTGIDRNAFENTWKVLNSEKERLL